MKIASDFRRAPWSTRDLTRVFGSFGSRVFNMLPEVCAFPCEQTKVESIFEGPCLNGIKSSKQRLHFRTSLLLARGSMKMSACRQIVPQLSLSKKYHAMAVSSHFLTSRTRFLDSNFWSHPNTFTNHTHCLSCHLIPSSKKLGFS